jgi:Golgi nucleoside diphosphatase
MFIKHKYRAIGDEAMHLHLAFLCTTCSLDVSRVVRFASSSGIHSHELIETLPNICHYFNSTWQRMYVPFMLTVCGLCGIKK